MLQVNLQKIEKILSLVLLCVKHNTIAGFTDQAKNLEILVKVVFNVCYGYNLINTNSNISNASHFDLDDASKKIKVQVTVNFNKAKLNQTLKGVTLPKDTKVYLIGLDKISDGQGFNNYISELEIIHQISIERINGSHLYQKIVGIADYTKIEYLLNTLEHHIDVTSLEVFDDGLALRSILDIFQRDAVRCHYSCEGSFSQQLKGLMEIKDYIYRGVVDGTKISSNKPLTKFSHGAERQYLQNLDDLLQDMIRAVRAGDKQNNNFFYYDQTEYEKLEKAQQALIDELNKNQFAIKFNLYTG